MRHHDDYANPLTVRWLCGRCHSKWHRANGRGANAQLQAATVKQLAQIAATIPVTVTAEDRRLAGALRKLIADSGLSINGFAKELMLRGVSSRTIRRWLAGTSPIPRQVWEAPHVPRP